MLPSQVSLQSFHEQMGDRAVLFIRPRKVQLHVGTRWPVTKTRMRQLNKVLPRVCVNLFQPILKKKEPFLIPDRFFGGSVPITQTPCFQKVMDLISCDGPVDQTLWFRQLEAELESRGKAQHKNILMSDRAEISAFLETYATRLVQSLKSEGFASEKGVYEAGAVIDARGRLVKSSSGNHRFAISHILDIPVFPLRIVSVHADWYHSTVATKDDSSIELLAALKRIEAVYR